MDNDSSEIAKLTERIAKDPKSKLFVPLAEEYKKAGDIEMSIHVLTEGIKRNPGYITAKSFLGALLLEKGDLQAAKKEFEEVVKAIPDNLMAQRKLGDVYALEGNREKAVLHYKTVQALNPKDEEVRYLITEIEAGRSVKERILAQTSAAKTDKPEAAQKAVPTTGKAGVPPKQTPLTQKAAPQVEEAEEVLIVEPLEEEGPAFGELDFLAERPVEPSPVHETGAEGLFAEAPAAAEPGLPVPEVAEICTQERPGAPDRSADDLTTNTLAELYISQGFYEKAIDIYERMLAENPGNKIVIDKLAHVRAMAGQQAPSTPSEAAVADAAGPAPTPHIEDDIAAWTPPSPEPDPFGAGPVDLEPKPAVEPEGFGGFEPGFEPRPYEPARQEAAPEVHEETGHIDRAKKETIERLEQWLKNIMKEKQK